MFLVRRLFATILLVALPCYLCSCQLLYTAVQLGLAKLAFSCVPEGTEIDTPNGPVPIESLNAGDQVIGFSGETVIIQQKHQYHEDEKAERFMIVTFDNSASVKVCDMHRIEDVRAMNLKIGDIAGGHRVTSVETFGGVQRSYDLLTDDSGYRISGIPVNSMIVEMAEAARNQSMKK